MVILVLDKIGVTLLEQLLVDNNIPFQRSLNVYSHGISAPYLIVDGVPIDETRAKKWIKERSNND